MNDNLTDAALEGYRESGEEISFVLHDGGSVTGKVLNFDGYTVIVSGSPDYMLYRHSILKFMTASAASGMARKQASTKPKTGAPSGKKAGRPRKEARRDTPAEPKSVPGSPGFSNPMADAMQEWLKSQKGGG